MDGDLSFEPIKKQKTTRPMSMSQSSEFHKMSHATFGNPGGPSVSSGNRRHSGKLSSNAGS
jgi:hypothetical protein